MRALVTGAARGIGRAVADALTAGGADVVACDIRPERDEVELDVSNAEDVARFVAAAGPLDVVFNNAGIARRTPPTDPWARAVADFDEIVATNLRGAYLVGRAVIPGMVARGSGHIVNVTTDRVHASMDAYDASKWGLAGLTRAWATTLEPHGIRVNSLSVGATDTPMLRAFLGGEPAPALVASWLSPEHVATEVLALLAEGPGGRTGDDVRVCAPGG